METFVAIVKAIPALKDLFDQIVAAYVSSQIQGMKQAHRDGIRKAVQEQDQRDLERAIGNPQAGEHSGLPSTEIRDSLPGVRP